MQLQGLKVLVTGGTSGIGQAIVTQSIAAGATTLFFGRNQTAGEAIAQRLGRRAYFQACDLEDSTSIPGAMDRAIAQLGSIDVLITAHGMTEDQLTIRMSVESFQRVLQVNTVATFSLCQEALKRMVRQRKGSIILLSSIVGEKGNSGQANYAASKGALLPMLRTFAKEYGRRGIRVNGIAPGFITTPMTEKLPDSYKEQIQEKIALKRFGTAEEVAQVALFLASDASSYIMGTMLDVHGGLLEL